MDKRIPQPIPDPDDEGHYKNVFDTPMIDDTNNQPRLPDDWQPRANIKRMFSSGKQGTMAEIQEFSKKFGVEKELVKKYVEHLDELKIRKILKKSQKEKEKTVTSIRKYDESNWKDLVLTGKLHKLLK